MPQHQLRSTLRQNGEEKRPRGYLKDERQQPPSEPPSEPPDEKRPRVSRSIKSIRLAAKSSAVSSVQPMPPKLDARVAISVLPSPVQDGHVPTHHVGTPPRYFKNPWDSFQAHGKPLELLYTKWGRSKDKTNVPVPKDRKELVRVRDPDWGIKDDPNGRKLKATWIGHATWLIEVPVSKGSFSSVNGGASPERGVRILFDPVFSERTSPFTFLGPKRYNPTPCTLEELPDVDVVVISHNHYDHLDITTVERLYAKQGGQLTFLCPLGNKAWFMALSAGIVESDIAELDWWQSAEVIAKNVGRVRLTCTPSQHSSARGPFDKDKTLWCSWVVEEFNRQSMTKVFFAGDTGYRAVLQPDPTPEEQDKMPVCPAFKEIGDNFGPFDLALLPIGLYSPRDFMSSVHCAPEDSVCIHKDIRSRKSIGMHYGTIRGGLSAAYEDVREPPIRWRQACEKAGLRWGTEAALCDIGSTVII